MTAAISVYPTLDQRPVKNTIVLFDVDDTLTLPRQVRIDVHRMNGHSHLRARKPGKFSH
jgi:hypothetical protein